MNDTSASQSFTLNPISIELTLPERHKSLIGSIVWADIPPFAVLTGLNGAGKSQLLEALGALLGGKNSWVGGALTRGRVTVVGESFSHAEVSHMRSAGDFSGGVALGLSQLQDQRGQLFNNLRDGSWRQNHQTVVRRAALETRLGKSLDSMSMQQFISEFPDDFAFMLDEHDVTIGLAYVFLAYRIRAAQEREKGQSESEIISKLGVAPWDLANEILARTGFQYRIVSPMQSPLLAHYQLKLRPLHPDLPELNPGDLSSGERTLLQVVLWLYNAQHHARYPKIFLLDEPDAHLHPSFAQHFIEVMYNILVKRFGIRVILTTHSPSTVALAPEEALFEMWSHGQRVRKSSSKAATIGLLTAGLVTVSATTRFTIVEDESDVEFYGCIRDLLSDFGPSKDSMSLAAAPSIVFLPASVGSGSTKIGGGASIVKKWIEKLDGPPLSELVVGVVDRDSDNLETDRVLVIGRYNIENYILDPVNVFCWLIERRLAPPIPGIEVSAGDEHRIRELSSDQIQSIVDSILATVAAKMSDLKPEEKEAEIVQFTNGHKVSYPKWMLHRNGHDLLMKFQACYGVPRVFNVPRLLDCLRRTRLIPVELALLLQSVQGFRGSGPRRA